MKEVYHQLGKIVRQEYRTNSETNYHRTLLHLSMMIGLPTVNDRHLMTLCK